LAILLTGADGTPYSQGLWHLHLKIPTDYPKAPPKATFKTRIYHPNVDEKTGAVCLETLKRDWDPKLTLKDILITISCLLIQPNPDSALNASAGALIQEDYDAFSNQARLMSSIHAPIPGHLLSAVREAKCRGEEIETSTGRPAGRSIEPEDDDTKENSIRKSALESTNLRPGLQSQSRMKRPLAELPTAEIAEIEPTMESAHKRKSPRTSCPEAVTLGGGRITSPLAGPRSHYDQHDAISSVEPPSAARKQSMPLKRRAPRVGIRRL
jgi:ubiquitin-conjugating enzyme E2 S